MRAYSNDAYINDLTRAGWRGERAAWEALVRSRPLLERAVELALRGYPEYRDRRDELAQAVLCSRARRVLEGCGLPVAAPPRNPRAWLLGVYRNAARSQLRTWRRRDHRRAELDLDRVAAGDGAAADGGGAVDPEAVQRALDALGALPPRYALAWLLRHAPECLDRELIERACAPERRCRAGTTGGLVRGPEETAAALERWLERHGRRPGSYAARRELAWVLRSDDPGPPEAWARREPAALRRALDTVGTWTRRAREQLRRAR